MFVCVYVSVCMCVCLSVCLSMCLHVCIYVCLYVQAEETVLQFTNRVKADIARQGGLVDLDW